LKEKIDKDIFFFLHSGQTTNYQFLSQGIFGIIKKLTFVIEEVKE
jgi:hypothetical protein